MYASWPLWDCAVCIMNGIYLWLEITTQYTQYLSFFLADLVWWSVMHYVINLSCFCLFIIFPLTLLF